MDKRIKDGLGFHWSNLMPFIAIVGLVVWVVLLYSENTRLDEHAKALDTAAVMNANRINEQIDEFKKLQADFINLKQEQAGRKDGKVRIRIGN